MNLIRYADFSTTFEKQAVKMSLDNLYGYASIDAAVKEGRLSLHGFWFDIETARLHRLDTASDQFSPL
ncbi:MAG: carbonic anhydrase [Candidatus Micropelagos thuwalensis]